MTPQLEVDHLCVEAGGTRILDDISLRYTPGEALAVVGPSGAGKTTLLRALLGLRRGASGSVRLGGRPVHRLSGRQRAAELAWLPQMAGVVEPVRVLDLVAAARFRFDEGRGASEAAAGQALAACGIAALWDHTVDTLSGGELQRVSMAGLLAQDARSFLLDEPSNHLDIRRQRDLYGLLGDQWRSGRGLILTTHDVNLLFALGQGPRGQPVRVLALESGRLAWERSLDADDLAECLGELYGLPLISAVAGAGRVIVPEVGP